MVRGNYLWIWGFRRSSHHWHEINPWPRANACLNLVMTLVDQIVPLVRKQVTSSRDTEEQVAQLVSRNIDLGTWKQKFAGNNKEDRDTFDLSIESLIDVTYKEAKLR
jgi:hypothetical protein